jgi:hypothetical protein
VIKTADYLIDLGPEGGDRGGNIVAVGTPEQVAKKKGSFTGYYLSRVLGDARARGVVYGDYRERMAAIEKENLSQLHDLATSDRERVPVEA